MLQIKNSVLFKFTNKELRALQVCKTGKRASQKTKVFSKKDRKFLNQKGLSYFYSDKGLKGNDVIRTYNLFIIIIWNYVDSPINLNGQIIKRDRIN